MRDDGSRPDLAAAHTRADERVRQALRSAEQTRDSRRERTYLLCQLGGVALSCGFTTADALGTFLEAAGRLVAPGPRR